MLHPEKNVRQSMMSTSKYNTTRGPQTTNNVGGISNSTKLLNTTSDPVQHNGPVVLPGGTKNGKRAGVVIIPDKDNRENGNCLAFQ